MYTENAYRTLVVSSSSKFNEGLMPLLTAAHCDPVTFTDSISAAKRQTLENQFDYVIINAPLPDDTGTKFAIDFSSGKSGVCLLLVRSDMITEIRVRLTPYGVFTLPKPIASGMITQSLNFMEATLSRLKRLEKKTVSIEEKMEEIRLVNRAKWLLIERLKMTEPDAHRYIEKQTMDTCTTKCETAREIIKTYA